MKGDLTAVNRTLGFFSQIRSKTSSMFSGAVILIRVDNDMVPSYDAVADGDDVVEALILTGAGGPSQAGRGQQDTAYAAQ